MLWIAAISTATLTTYITVLVLGAFITAVSVILIVDTLTFWWGRWSGFFLHLIVGILYLCAGIMLIEHPLLGTLSITLVMGAAYTVIGIFRLVYVLSTRLISWGWGFLYGVVTLLLGILILESWPASSLFILGLFVGIDLFFVGWAYIIMSLTAKRAVLTQ